MNDQNDCSCTAAPKLIFACSGAADLGEITDRAARQLTQQGIGKMFCTAGLGGHVSGILQTTKSAQKILALDGCPLHCVKNSLEQAGFTEYEHLCLTDMGMEKGKTPPTDEKIDQVIAKAQTLL